MSWSEEEWQIIARAEWDRWEADRKAAAQYVADQSKWMVAQLFVANGGALASLTASRSYSDALPIAGAWFVSGLVLAMLCGLLTWLHAQALVITFYNRGANMLLDRETWGKEEPQGLSPWLHGGAIVCGFVSLALFLLGVVRAAAVIG